MKDLRLVSGYDVLYGKVKTFVRDHLFEQEVELEAPNTLRNLSDIAATKAILESFKKAINALTVREKGDAEIRDHIKLRETRPFVVKEQGYVVSKKSVFNRTIGDSGLELKFARFLETCEDVVSYAKNYMAVGFKLDYVTADRSISNYIPDFIVKLTNGEVWIVETKGREVYAARRSICFPVPALNRKATVAAIRAPAVGRLWTERTLHGSSPNHPDATTVRSDADL
jgi:type III restriction enzyme